MIGRRIAVGLVGCSLLAACVPARDVIGTATPPSVSANATGSDEALDPLAVLGTRAVTGDGDGDGPGSPTGRFDGGAVTTRPAPRGRPAWAVDPATSGGPWPGAKVEGLLTFRGNPTRSWYGAGPVPVAPRVQWRFPETGGLCSESTEGGQTSTWCGTGWTGQPAIWEGSSWGAASPAGDRTLVAFGAYDGGVHVLDAERGEAVLPRFPTGDLIKGSVTIDPDGYPLLYVGSRDGNLRAIALDRDVPTELWRFNANEVGPTMWNDDWDGAPMVVGGMLVEGGENSRFHVFRLHRGRDASGRVTVAPTLLFDVAGWDDELLEAVGSPNVSIENSVAISGTVAYFANSGGLVQGWDLAPLEVGGAPRRTFRFWMGDDVDASVVVDADGFLYVAAEYERDLARAAEVGQLVKLDPRRVTDPVVWSLPLRTGGVPSGAWATPAIWRDVVIAATHAGELLAVDRQSGRIRWQKQLAGPTWSSPVVVDDVLIQADCGGVIRAWDLEDTTVDPPLLWSVQLPNCIESTPAVWRGHIVVGTRGGAVFGLGD